MNEDKEFWKELMGDDFDMKEFVDKGEGEDNDLLKDLPGFEPENSEEESQNLPPIEPVSEIVFKVSDETENIGGKRKKKDRRRASEDDYSTGDSNFEMDFDFDNEYQDVNEKTVKRGRSKRTGCLDGVLHFLFIICISLIIACFGWMCATDVLGLGAGKATIEVTLDKELFTEKTVEKTDEEGNAVTETVTVADIDAVTDVLHESGLIRYKWLFKLFAKFSSADTKISYGTYLLNENYDYRALVVGMTRAGGKKVEIDITIPEGYTMNQIITLLERERVCDSADLLEAAKNYDFDYDFLSDSTLGDEKRLEGYLFPDTYTFYINDTPSRVLGKMLTNFNNKWTEEFDELAEERGYSMADIINIAAMIEKEAGGNSERATIASVIYNRLENPDASAGTNGYLQIDATIYYAIEGTDQEFSQDIDSPYNTYKYPGLPTGPIANPGLASIEAALEPEDTRYYYYALGTEGLHEFFTNYDDFVNFVNSDEYGG